MNDDIGYFQVGNVTLRAEPAREECFTVVYRDADMHEHDDRSEAARRENLHRHMTNEMVSLEIAAACVHEFPDAPWELRMDLARQCWDEARHIRVLYRRLRELGGFKGEFPIGTLEWNVTCALDNLIGRLATQNRTLEAGAMDVVGILARDVRALGDNETADILEGILADEVQHVRFANRWIKRFVSEDRRQLMKVASAVRFLMEANSKFQIKDGGEVNVIGVKLASPEARIPAVNVEDRRLAEFTDEEIHEILRQAGFRTLVSGAAT
jgi:uncharacterized ferritin-like protein (DUF455 family)